MNNADYQAVLLDPRTGGTLDIIPQTRWRRLQYRKVLNGIGNIAMTLTADDRAIAHILATEDIILEIYRRNRERALFELEESFIVRLVNPFSDENGTDWFIVGGDSLNILLKQRIIDPQDDPNSAGGYLTYFDDCASVMQDLVRYQCQSPQIDSTRAYANFSVSANTEGEDVYFREFFGTNLFEQLAKLEPQGRVDFIVRRDTAFSGGIGLKFIAARQGRDRTKTNNYPGNPYLLFSEVRGTIREPNFSINSTDEINAIYVQGQGPENDREILLVQNDSRVSAGPFSRKEDTTDARNTDNVDGLITTGKATLEEKRQRISFTFLPDLQRDGLQYNIDWSLGDSVTAIYKNFEDDFRIKAVIVSTDQDTENIQIELDNENV